MATATPAPVSPTPRRLSRPRWLDPRIIGGVVLVILAVVAGAKVVGASKQTAAVWAAAHDMAAGTVLSAADLTAVEVNLGDSATAYLGTGTVPAGRALTSPVRGGELLPAAVIAAPADGRVVAVGVQPEHLPPGVAHGSVIDLYLTSGGSGTSTPVKTELVARRLTVQQLAAPASGGLSGAVSNRFQLSVLLDAATADNLVRTLPTGEPIVVLISGATP